MSKVRVLVGTRKGAFVLTSDGKREQVGRQRAAFRRLGDVPPEGLARRSESALCVAVERMVRAVDPALRRWRQDVAPAGTPPDTCAGSPKARATSLSTMRLRPAAAHTHQWYDGTQHPWEFKRVWHLEPSLNDPDTVYAGVEDAALFRSTDGGRTGRNSPACADTVPARSGSPARAACACTRLSLIPSNPQRIYIAISAAGAFRTDDGGKTGSRSTADCIRNTFPIRMPKWATACTTSR